MRRLALGFGADGSTRTICGLGTGTSPGSLPAEERLEAPARVVVEVAEDLAHQPQHAVLVLAHPQDDLHPRQVHAQLVRQAGDRAQPLQVLLAEAARPARRALRREQPQALVLADRLLVQPGELGDDTDAVQRRVLSAIAALTCPSARGAGCAWLSSANSRSSSRLRMSSVAARRSRDARSGRRGPLPARCGKPLPRRRSSWPLCVPGGIFICTSPSIVGTSIVADSAASGKVTGAVR